MAKQGGLRVSERFDVVVIGAGPGGYVAAIRAAQLGLKVAIIEKRDTLGGTCLNVGCIPSKALLESSELYHRTLHKLKRHGILVGSVELDLAAMMSRKDKVVRELVDGLRFLMKKNKIGTVLGHGRLTGPHAVTVEAPGGKSRDLEARDIILATGSEPIELPFLKFDGQVIVSSTEALAFDAVPRHLVVIGAGAVGLELGSVWSRLGAQVTVVEFLPRIVPFADHEIGELLRTSLQKQGLEFHLETKVTGAIVEGKKAVVQAQKADGTGLAIECDRVLVSVGRKANSANLGLETVGIKPDARLKVAVDDQFRTAVPSIRAIGDLIDGPMLAHKAEDEGVACAELIAGKAGHVNRDAIPNVVYTWPELASVGLTEEDVKQRGIAYRVGRYPFQPNGRAKAMDETEGLVKILAQEQTDRLLGVHIVGPWASDLIAEAVLCLEFGGSAEDLARTCHAHPTLSEVVREAALGVARMTIHG